MILGIPKIPNTNQSTDVYWTCGVRWRISVNNWPLHQDTTSSWWNGVRAVCQTVQMDKIIPMAWTTLALQGLVMFHDLYTCSPSWPPVWSTWIWNYAVWLFAPVSRSIHKRLIITPQGSRTPFPLCSLADPAAPERESCMRGRRSGQAFIPL